MSAPDATIATTGPEPAARFRVVGFTDLPPADERSHGLSGIAWDGDAEMLWAVRDRVPQLLRLEPSSGFRKWTLADGPEIGGVGDWDGEGLAHSAAGFFCSDESGPRVLPLDAAGAAGPPLDLPAHFAHALPNKSFESLSFSPDGRFLFTANEGPLPEDGPPASTDRGALLRILRIDLSSGERTERAYRTDAVFAPGKGSLGVSDLTALSADRLVVMERAWVRDRGNAVRLYRIDLDRGPDVLETLALTDAAPVLPKELLLDLATLPDDGFPAPVEPQPTRVLANYEGLSIGPALPDGTRLLFLQSDDNSQAIQISRLLVLAAVGL